MKKLTAKVGEYTNDQGETKGRYVDLGVVLDGDNGEYVLLDPSVNLAGVLIKQNAFMATKGKSPKDSVMVSVFDRNGSGQPAQPAQGGYNQQPAAQQPVNQPQTGGFNPANAPQQPQQGFQNQPQRMNQPPQQGYQQPPSGGDDWEDD